MSDELSRIEALEKTVAALTTKIDYMAMYLGFKPQRMREVVEDGSSTLGQKQIASNPNRTETGMGPILSPENSKFV